MSKGRINDQRKAELAVIRAQRLAKGQCIRCAQPRGAHRVDKTLCPKCSAVGCTGASNANAARLPEAAPPNAFSPFWRQWTKCQNVGAFGRWLTKQDALPEVAAVREKWFQDLPNIQFEEWLRVQAGDYDLRGS